MNITREQSTFVKGFAILIMIYGHVFKSANADQCGMIYFISINNCPLWKVLAIGVNPVHIFLILSGYGLCRVFEKGSLTLMSEIKRVMKLYISYWIIIFLLIIVGNILHPGLFPVDARHIIGNLTGMNNLYCGNNWFLLPYALLSLLSPYIVKRIYNRPLLGEAVREPKVM